MALSSIHNHKTSSRIAAALDLGSNTLRLIVARVEPKCAPGGEGRPKTGGAGGYRYHALAREIATPRLGRGLTRGGELSSQAMQAAFKRAAGFVTAARDMGAVSIALAASQACRKAANGPEFVERLGRELGLDEAVILTGEQEARLSSLGVMSRLDGDAASAWLADVGGGSSEVAPLAAGHAQPPLSLELGAVSLSERHQKSDPPEAKELAAMAGDAMEVLKPLKDFSIGRLVATAGTAATLASLVLKLDKYSPDKVNNLVVTRQELERQLDRLAALPLAERRNLAGLEPERADIILAGLVILRSILMITELDRLTAMDAGLLEGILLDSLNRLP